MNELSAPTKKGCGCLLALLVLLLLIASPLILNQFSHTLRTLRPVFVTLLDQDDQPVAGAQITVRESEFILLIPLLPFGSPHRTAERTQTVITDSNGQVHFYVQYAEARGAAVNLNGVTLPILRSQSTDTFRGPSRWFLPPGEHPEWNAVGNLAEISFDTTIVVSHTTQK